MEVSGYRQLPGYQLFKNVFLCDQKSAHICLEQVEEIMLNKNLDKLYL